MNLGLKRSCVYQSASASTMRPSASVLLISMVVPDIALMMSPGRTALPSGMFSTRPMTPTALTFALRPARPRSRPVTAAAPPMSPFMSSMPAPGLIEITRRCPETARPCRRRPAARSASALPPFQRMMARRAGLREPQATQSSEFMPSLRMSSSVRISTSRPISRSFSTSAAYSTGPSTLGGSLMRSRARSATSLDHQHAVGDRRVHRGLVVDIEGEGAGGGSLLSSPALGVLLLSKR